MLRLEVVNIDKKSATAECRFDYDEEFVEFYKKETGAKRVLKSNVGKFIQRYLSEATNSTPINN
jgi:hypothetical protein